MKIIKRSGLTIMLAIAVLISFILSIILWANPSYERPDHSRTIAKDNLISKSLAYTYEPTQAIYTRTPQDQHLLTNSSVNLIGEIVKNMRHYDAYRMNEISRNSSQRYVHYLNYPHSIMLNYEGEISVQILNSVVHGGMKQLPNHYLNRIVLPLRNHNVIYLLNDHYHRVYRVSVSPRSLKALRHLARYYSSQMKIRVRSRDNHPFVRFSRSVSMPQYEYLVSRRTRNYNVVHLLNGHNQIGRKIKEGKRIYSSGSNRLIFGKYQDVKYVNNDSLLKSGGLSKTLNHSYRNLLTLKLPMNGMHYFDYRPKQKTVLYREYIEGFPIFNPTQFGTVGLHYNGDQISYLYSLNSLQIPIPNQRRRIRLPATRKVISTLRSKGYDTNKIQSIEIGYEWRSAKSSKILANLIPGWFIKYNHHWINYNQITGD